MGTSIHGVWEVHVASWDGRGWVNAGDIDDSRSYQVFATLAGVRAEVCRERGDPFTTIAEPRGLPKDMGYTTESATNYEQECGCLLRPSWLTLRELIDAKQPWLDILIAQGWAVARGRHPDVVRMVFWFS